MEGLEQKLTELATSLEGKSKQEVKAALATGAAGAISGSAVVKIIENNLNDNQAMLKALSIFVIKMKAATL